MSTYEELIKRLTIAREKEIPEQTVSGIIIELKKVPIRTAQNIVYRICTNDPMPRNLYGAICKSIRDEVRTQEKQTLQRESWNTRSEDNATPHEWTLYWKCLIEIMHYHRLHWIKRNENAVLSCDNNKFNSQYYTAWESGVWPPMHSDVIDKFVSEYRNAYSANLLDGKSLVNFLAKFYARYHENRMKAIKNN